MIYLFIERSYCTTKENKKQPTSVYLDKESSMYMPLEKIFIF